MRVKKKFGIHEYLTIYLRTFKINGPIYTKCGTINLELCRKSYI